MASRKTPKTKADPKPHDGGWVDHAVARLSEKEHAANLDGADAYWINELRDRRAGGDRRLKAADLGRLKALCAAAKINPKPAIS